LILITILAPPTLYIGIASIYV